MRKVFAFSLEEKSGRSISGAKVIGIMSSFMWRCTITLMLAEAIFEKRRGIFTHQSTVFENHRKSLIQHCERSDLRLHFEWTKVN